MLACEREMLMNDTSIDARAETNVLVSKQRDWIYNRLISIYSNSAKTIDPQHQATGCKPHKRCGYSPEPPAVLF